MTTLEPAAVVVAGELVEGLAAERADTLQLRGLDRPDLTICGEHVGPFQARGGGVRFVFVRVHVGNIVDRQYGGKGITKKNPKPPKPRTLAYWRSPMDTWQTRKPGGRSAVERPVRTIGLGPGRRRDNGRPSADAVGLVVGTRVSRP